MDLQLRGKVALVAASSRGLGRAIAEALAAEGADLVLAARDAVGIAEVARELASRHGVKAIGIRADVSVDADVKALVATALREFGRVDILVTNAGGPPAGTFESLPADAWPKAVALTLESVVGLCRGVLPGMKERRWGRILNVTSIAVKQPVDNLILSNSLRAAVTGFARTLANEVAPFGITVNNLATRAPNGSRTSPTPAPRPTAPRRPPNSPSGSTRSRWAGSASRTSSPRSLPSWPPNARVTSPPSQ